MQQDGYQQRPAIGMYMSGSDVEQDASDGIDPCQPVSQSAGEVLYSLLWLSEYTSALCLPLEYLRTVRQSRAHSQSDTE